mmetsp:Transcript_32118/g.103671  ORF Transcript_32118/g.103671 Transcript_32118/m.103671 type:complete len:360 (-) Transcript_32118:91-1170(-)|eukprot:scaffold11973_cov112-Isochrysis_galbana.AAC.1
MARHARKASQQRHTAAWGERQQAPLILEQHRTLGGAMAGELMILLVERAGLRPRRLPGTRRHPGARGRRSQAEACHAHGCLIDHNLIQPAGTDRRHDASVVHPARGGHLEIDTGSQADHPVGDPAPVGHHHPFEPPLVAQDAVVEPVVLGALRAVQLVVRAHHCPRARARDGRLEGGQVDLAQGPLVHHRVDGHAVRLLVVGRIVLYGRAHAMRLHTQDEVGRKLSRHERVLGEVLEVATAQRVPLDVHAGAQEHADLERQALPAQRIADSPRERRVPGSSECAGGREARRGRRAIEAKVRRAKVAAHSVGAVGHVGSDESKTLDRLQLPERLTGAQRRLLAQCHLPDERLGLKDERVR